LSNAVCSQPLQVHRKAGTCSRGLCVLSIICEGNDRCLCHGAPGLRGHKSQSITISRCVHRLATPCHSDEQSNSYPELALSETNGRRRGKEPCFSGQEARFLASAALRLRMTDYHFHSGEVPVQNPYSSGKRPVSLIGPRVCDIVTCERILES